MLKWQQGSRMVGGVIVAALLLTGCQQSPSEPPPGNPATEVGMNREAPAIPPPAGVANNTPLTPPTGKPVEGGKFNKLFPADEGAYDVIYTQEKQGFAQAVLEQNKQKVAELSISDMVTNPDAINKYQNASQTIAGYPAVSVGSNGTAVLVGSRFQVQVRTRPGQNFSAQDREAWIGKFKLAELAQMGGN
ncbi:MAG: hypothetical protein OHK0029_03350 [Armatimonadaceae bacterium]